MPREEKQAALKEVGQGAFTISEFCLRNKIAPSTYYKLQTMGKGPREMVVGSRAKRISEEAERDWHRECEAAASAA